MNRPTCRGDCADIPRPCPFVTCRYHLLPSHGQLTDDNALDLLETMPETCCLDVAEDGPHELRTVAQVLGLTRERIRQNEVDALAKLTAYAPA